MSLVSSSESGELMAVVKDGFFNSIGTMEEEKRTNEEQAL